MLMYIYKLTKYPKPYIAHQCLMKIALQLMHHINKNEILSMSKKQPSNILCKTQQHLKEDFSGVNISKRQMIQYS